MITMDRPVLTSLGYFILDENRYPESWNRPTEYEIIGGGGVYAVVGALIVVGEELAPRIAGIIDMGNDFPSVVRKQLSAWKSGLVFRSNMDRATTRGANVYGEDNIRRFRYLSPKLRIEAQDILVDPTLFLSESYHLCCSPRRATLIVSLINDSRPSDIPRYCFEPSPPDCVAANYSALVALLPRLTVFSPNFEEACSFLELSTQTLTPAYVASTYAAYLALPNSAVVLRCGEKGCFVHTVEGECFALPAYHSLQKRVVDVTGGGNLFCGAYIASHVLSGGNVMVAAVCGILALGAVVETLGIPSKDDGDRWNGLSLKDRYKVYRSANPQLKLEWNDFLWLRK